MGHEVLTEVRGWFSMFNPSVLVGTIVPNLKGLFSHTGNRTRESGWSPFSGRSRPFLLFYLDLPFVPD